jgi:hypothetical protein
MPISKKQLWFKARATSKTGSTQWFTVYRSRTVLIEAVLPARKRAGTKALPQLVNYRCDAGVKTEEDVMRAIKSNFKVAHLQKIPSR